MNEECLRYFEYSPTKKLWAFIRFTVVIPPYLLSFQYYFHDFFPMFCVFAGFSENKCPRVGFSTIFLPQGSGFRTFFVPRGRGIRLSRNFLGVRRGGGCSGLEFIIIDTLVN